MKRTRSRSLPVLIITLGFFVGIVYFVVNLVIHSAQWASMPQNAHLSDNSELGSAGTITDRNGVVLAKSENGRRVYNEDEDTRKACLHVVGDDSVNISTAIQTLYRSELTGYDFIFGLGLPSELKKGKDIRLTIDSKIQKAAYNALGDNRGAVVVCNYKTGEILCMASTPTYDPMNKPEDIDSNEDYEGAYLNKAISAAYPPGSTFKLVTAASALENFDDAESREMECTGSDIIGGQEINCFEVSGWVDLRKALMESCNVYFAHTAVDLGKDKMTAQAKKMGFNRSWKFDGIETVKSRYDVSKATENELAWSGVGQYTVLESPMNMALRTSAVANGGVSVKPMVVKNISLPMGLPAPDKSSSDGDRMMSKEVADKLADMMDYTVENYYGKSSFTDRLDICAKTGTAEVSEGGNDAHAWVTGFSKDKDCPIAFSVIVEHGNSGSGVAIPTASTVLEVCADAFDK